MADVTVSTGVDGFMRTGRTFRGSYQPGDVIVEVGDSNMNGRPDWGVATDREWLEVGGIFYGCDLRNYAQNGSQIQGWVLSIAEGDQEATERVDGTVNVWLVKNAAPKLIIVQLGTNELFNAARRSAEGVEATMQANYDTLVQWFVDNTDADLLLCIPQPFGQPNGFGDWADADACAASSEQLRRVHLNCSNANNPRVRIWDSHQALFGLRCDDIETDCLDPETGEPMLYDDLHKNALGFRRETEYVARFLSGRNDRPFTSMADSNPTAMVNAIWSETLYLNQVTVAGTDLSSVAFVIDPMSIFDEWAHSRRDHNRPKPETQQAYLPAIRVLSQYGAAGRLVTAGANTDTANLFCYCHNSGNVYSFGRLRVTSTVTATNPYYVLMVADYHKNYDHDTEADWSTSDVGPVTFWVENDQYLPKLHRNEQIYSFTLFPDAHVGTAGTAVGLGYQWNWLVPFDLREVTLVGGLVQTPPSGAASGWHVIRAEGGYGGTETYQTPLGYSFADGSRTGSGSGVISKDYLAGDLIELYCTGNAGNAKGHQFSFTGRRTLS